MLETIRKGCWMDKRSTLDLARPGSNEPIVSLVVNHPTEMWTTVPSGPSKVAISHMCRCGCGVLSTNGAP